jgi:hypothetical protein
MVRRAATETEVQGEVLRNMVASMETSCVQLFEDTTSASGKEEYGRTSWTKESVDEYTRTGKARPRRPGHEPAAWGV